MQQYRADIDGLRAVAVLSVIVFHLNERWLPNGFLGVDVFFVISGFLITSIIYREARAGQFSLSAFYARRIRRILPVCFVVVFVALGVSRWLFLPEDAHAVAKSAVASSAFLANIFFARQGEYFDPGVGAKPLLHLWSLSVEEQFYFLFPLLLILVLRLVRRRAEGEHSARRQGLWLYGILGGLLALSLLSALTPLARFGLHWDPYYLPHSRFSELLVGAILAIVLARQGEQRAEPSGRASLPMHLLGVLSFIILIGCLLLEGLFASRLFPGLLAMLPCLAAAGMLYSARDDSPLRRLLSLLPLVWLGRLSYSLYLWHWVVLALVRYFWGESALPLSIVWFVLGVTLGLSVVTYYAVEQPIRHLPLSFGRSLLLLYIAPASLVAGYALLPQREVDLEPTLLNAVPVQECFDAMAEGCVFGEASREATVLVAGDSHTGHLMAFIDYVGRAEGWSALVSGSASCPFFLDYTAHFSGQKEAYCQWRNAYLSETYTRYSTIILANYWSSDEYATDPTFVPHLLHTLQVLQASGRQVVLINSAYRVESTRLHEYRLARLGLGTLWERSDGDLRGERYYAQRERALRLRSLVQQQFPEVRWVDLLDLYPSDLLIEGKPMMKDQDHLNVYGSEMIARRFVEQGRRLLAPAEPRRAEP